MDPVIRIQGWEWKECDFGHYHFWNTKDPSGNWWVVKFTGSFYSYREWVFSRLASRLGLNTRNVALAWISKQDLLKTGHKDTEPFQLLLKPVEGHADGSCNSDCPFPEFKRRFGEENDIPAFLSSLSSLCNAVDYVLKDYLADIFGANEPSECLLGADHRFYTIDNEQMFSTEPSGKISAPWLFAGNGDYSESGHKLLFDLCRKIAFLRDGDLREISRRPNGYRVDMLWSILPILRKGKRVAQSIIRNGPIPYGL